MYWCGHRIVIDWLAKLELFLLVYILYYRVLYIHVLWQVSFGCWVTWSISSWQEYYKSVLFPKSEWWVAELLFLYVLKYIRTSVSNRPIKCVPTLLFSIKKIQKDSAGFWNRKFRFWHSLRSVIHCFDKIQWFLFSM